MSARYCFMIWREHDKKLFRWDFYIHANNGTKHTRMIDIAVPNDCNTEVKELEKVEEL